MDLTPDLTATLKRHLTWLRAEALRQGTGEPEWLFPKADGTLMNKDCAAGVFRRLLKRTGLPHYRVHDLRHTYASLLLAESAPITYVSAQLQHSSPATTMRFYARWIPSHEKRWVDALDRKPSGRKRSAAARAPVEPESGTSGFLINRRGPVKSRPSVFPRRSARPAVIARRSRARVQDRHGLLSRARTYSKGFSEDGSRKITQALWDQRSTDYPTGVRIWATYRGRRQY
ncbi:MAG: hypothetical protein DMD96_06140 [Candidatus Rokuibacteriota bacterium]|nr:MAG: hypothetical protein DMD96_06140 [Candidatus Rokubacteria bacterium]